jgi:uncharacterized protein
MSLEIGKAAIDRLIDEPSSRHNVSFFGGEPLLNYSVMRELVLYGEQKAKEQKCHIAFGLTTNGTMLIEEIAKFIHEHHIAVLFSLDGNAETTNRMRLFPNGQGIFDVASRKLSMLLRIMGTDTDRVMIRATFSRLNLNLPGIYRYLQGLGVRRVALVPAFVAGKPEFNLQENDLPALRDSYEALFTAFCDDVVAAGYSGDIQSANWLRRALYGRRSRQVCGAGCSYLGVSATGEYCLCHRFFDLPKFHMGTVFTGYDASPVDKIIMGAENASCSACWARQYCGGMCYHDAYMDSGCVSVPVPEQCRYIQCTIEMAIAVLSEAERKGFMNLVCQYLDASGPWADAEKLRPQQASGLLLRKVGEKYVAVNQRESVVINRTAREIIGLCNGSRTPASIAALLARRYQIQPKEAFPDVLTCLYDLKEKGIVM